MIRITFADGATEDRDDASPALCSSAAYHPEITDPARWTWPAVLAYAGTHHLGAGCARGRTVRVWRITSGKGEPLAGRWESCHGESYPEQIARLTAERDDARLCRDAWKASADTHDGLRLAEKARADAAEKRLADLRAWALKERGAVRDRGAAEAARGEDLAAAWCDGEAAALGELLRYIDGFPLREAAEWVVARIDGKDGESK